MTAGAPLALLAAALAVGVLPGRAPLHRAPRSGHAPHPGLRRLLFPAAGVGAALMLFGAPWWMTGVGAVAGGFLGGRIARRDRPMTSGDMRSLAAKLDLLAACLDAGLATATALSACLAGPAGRPGRGEEALAEVSALLLLGGQAAEAWRPVSRVPELVDLAAAAARSAVGGLTLADAARETAVALRASGRTAATARAARAGVAMTAPLTVCFLPAFLCLGLAPTVVGMVATIRLW
jgi:pilus assembly protein TadC